jgi:hypothetical protein
MNAFFIFFLFFVGLMPSWAYVLGPRAHMVSTGALEARPTTMLGKRDVGVPNWRRGDPVVTFINTSQKDRAYIVVRGAESPSTAFATCLAPCILVPAGETVRFFPGRGFVGAITATGSRHELNFLTSAGECWYDISMEYGMTRETLGPSDHRLQADGRSSINGEPDLLGKATAAWRKTPPGTQAALLATGYLTGAVGGDLTAVKMDRNAPTLVRDWYQLDAGFTAYMVPGSISGQHHLSEAGKQADTVTSHVLTNEMTITVY